MEADTAMESALLYLELEEEDSLRKRRPAATPSSALHPDLYSHDARLSWPALGYVPGKAFSRSSPRGCPIPTGSPCLSKVDSEDRRMFRCYANLGKKVNRKI
ncbi:hypothetical protein KM043_012090 [Ampulex compressa]|nr:hypothetical protein KM043_012090 [Ampulex compressa]